MSIIGKKGKAVKSIFSFLKEVGDLKIIEERIGAKQLREITESFIPVFFRYSEEKGMDFCLDHNILELAREGRTTKEILFEKEWKHEAMLEDLLNFLTWKGVLKKREREFHTVILPKQQKQIPSAEDKSSIKPSTSLVTHTKGVATLRDISPFEISHKEPQTEQQYGLLPKDRRWLEEAKPYKVVFTLFDRIISRFVPDALKTGTQPATLDDRPDQLGPLTDSYLMNPSLVIPRMAVIAAAVKQVIPTKLLDLNCGTGRGIEELLLVTPNAEIVGASDNLFQLRVAERNLAVFAEQRRLYPRLEWRVVDYSHPLPSQLEDLVGECNMVLVNQLFQFCPHAAHRRLINEIASFVKAGGLVAFFQHLRAEKELPWPHEWFFRAIHGFFGIPEEQSFRGLFKREMGKDLREIIPLAAYLLH
ncbi:MAG: class I SAM-dependent methyltransferase [Candidatus Heimdallarchaeota archaeon]